MMSRLIMRVRQFARPNGFTILEMLVAMTLLIMLVIILGSITSATTRATRLSNRAIDAASQARLAFDRIGTDLASMVKRSDTDFEASTASGNNALLFLSTVASDTGDRNLTLVAYRIAPHPDNQSRTCLIRAGVPVKWANTASIMGLKTDGTRVRLDGSAFPLPVAPSGSTANDFDVLAPGVLQMAVGYQLYPGTTNALMDGSAYPASSLPAVVYSPPIVSPDNPVADLSKVSALVVGLAVIDTENLKYLTPATAGSISALFPTPQNGQLPVQIWANTANDATKFALTIPLPARQAVRVYQRFYPINPSVSKEYQ